MSGWKIWSFDRPDTAAERWLLAERIIAGNEPEFVARLRRRRLVIVVVIVLIAVVCGPATGVVGGRGRHGRQAAEHVALWQSLLGFALLLAGMVLIGRLLLRFLRSERPVVDRNSPLWALNRGERRSIMRQATGREPVDRAHLIVIRAVAERVIKQAQPTSYLGGMILIFTGSALTTPSREHILFAVGLVVVLSVAFTWQRWYDQRMRAFLTAHPAGGYLGSS